MRDSEAAPLLEPLSEDERFASWHLVLRDRSLVGRGAGSVEVLTAMQLTRSLGRVLNGMPSGVVEACYGPVARRRGLLGRLVPDRAAPRRFP